VHEGLKQLALLASSSLRVLVYPALCYICCQPLRLNELRLDYLLELRPVQYKKLLLSINTGMSMVGSG
jgi:hypothetical protein